MKKLCVGVFLMFVLLSSQTASANPCGLCDGYYSRCDQECEHCVPFGSMPGMWDEGWVCWGRVVSGTCGDTGNCNGQLRASNWSSNPGDSTVLDEIFSDGGHVPCSGPAVRTTGASAQTSASQPIQ